MDERLAAAVRLRERGELKAARAALLELVAEGSDDAVVHYQTAWAHDVLGLESEAIPFYERALALGLHGEERAGALLGLGSTYRTLGRYDDAERTLRAGRESSVRAACSMSSWRWRCTTSAATRRRWSWC